MANEKTKQNKTRSSQLESAKKWNEKNAGLIGVRGSKENIDLCKEYAEKIGISPSRFGMYAMLHCIKHNIAFGEEGEE